MTCVWQMYAPFDVEVTDVDPGPAPHIESMVGGTPGQVGMSQGVGGVAPMNTDCSVVERAIVFTFADVYGDDVQSICETVAQESAHALGLDHEHLCQDPMTYLYGCGAKSFQDVDADCGEYSARECMCGGTTQNSVQTLLQILGASDRTPPAVEITEPANGAQVDPGFKVASTTSDDKGVSKVDLWIDDVLVLSDGEAPYEYADTAGLPPGPHTISARAYDAAGNVSTATVTVQVKMPGGGGGGGGGDDDDGGGDDGSGGSADDPTGDLHGGCAAAGRGASGSWRALAALLLVTFVSLRRRHPRR
jgi:hypothetical protein